MELSSVLSKETSTDSSDRTADSELSTEELEEEFSVGPPLNYGILLDSSQSHHNLRNYEETEEEKWRRMMAKKSVSLREMGRRDSFDGFEESANSVRGCGYGNNGDRKSVV